MGGREGGKEGRREGEVMYLGCKVNTHYIIVASSL